MNMLDPSTTKFTAASPEREPPCSGPGRLRHTAGAAVCGIALGWLATVVDVLPVTSGRVLLVLASTGLSWGLAAFILGATSKGWRDAAAAGFVVLVAATSSYYGAIYAAGLRPKTTSSELAGAMIAWLVIATIGGPAVGALGWSVRQKHWTRPLALGTAGGLLGSQGAYLYGRTWDPGHFGTGQFGEILPSFLILAPAALVAFVGRRHRPWLVTLTFAVVAVVCMPLWARLHEYLQAF